jgi:hypothetical protein
MSDTRLICVSSTVLVVHGIIMKCSNQGIQMLLCIAGSRDDAAMVGARWRAGTVLGACARVGLFVCVRANDGSTVQTVEPISARLNAALLTLARRL